MNDPMANIANSNRLIERAATTRIEQCDTKKDLNRAYGVLVLLDGIDVLPA